MTKADRWFERCARERGYNPGEHEPDLSERGMSKRPDYVVTNSADERAAFEVKAFTDKIPLVQRLYSRQPVSAGPDQVFGPIREHVKAAAAQLKGLAEEMPVVAVLANPDGVPFDHSTEQVLAALYGNHEYRMAINTATGKPGPVSFGLGRDGRLKTNHPYMSAVAILRHREHRQDAVDALTAETKTQPGWEEIPAARRAEILLDVINANSADFPDGDYFYVDVIDTMSASLEEGPALPLPDSWFGEHPRDSRWRYNPAGHFECVRGPAKVEAD